MVFDWVDILMSIGVVQGLFLIFSLLKIKDKNKQLNKALILLLSITSFMLLGRLLFFQFPGGTFDRYALIFDTVIFLFGPITYNFTNKLLFSNEDSRIKWRLHLIPASLHLIIAIFLLIAGQDFFIELYKQGYIMPYYFITEVLGILSNLIYVLLSFSLISSFREEETNQFSFHQDAQNFIKYFLIACLMLITIWIFSVINYRLGIVRIRVINYDVIWSIIPLLTYVIGYYMQKQPELFRIQKTFKIRSISQKRLSGEQIDAMKSKLDKLMTTKKIYLINDLTLPNLADKLGEKPNDVSWLLNESYKSTFYDFINKYRIEELLDKINNNEHIKTTLLGLAYECGFNSKSTFNKAFKKVTSKTPSEYINEYSSLATEKKMSA